MSLLRPGVIKQPKPKPRLLIHPHCLSSINHSTYICPPITFLRNFLTIFTGSQIQFQSSVPLIVLLQFSPVIFTPIQIQPSILRTSSSRPWIRILILWTWSARNQP